MRDSEGLFLPLGPLYLAHSLDKAGYSVSIVDEENQKALSQIEQLISNNTLCIGISSMSGTQLGNAFYIAKELKARYPNMPLVWGGVHATALPEQTLRNNLVDYIVWGEAENTILLLLNAIRNNDMASLTGVLGIGYKKGNSLVINGNSGYTSLDKVFNLPYHLIDMIRYSRKLIIGAEREYPIYTSRGCVFKCRFCSNSSSIWPNTSIRNHSIDHIVNDVKTLVTKYGADMINFADQNFLIDENRFLKIFDAIRKSGIFVKYRFSARIDLLLRLKEETWKAMKEYGVIGIATAPESGSQRILDYMDKRITLEQIYKLDDLLSKYNFYKTYNVLICTPRETREDLKQTLKLVMDLARTSMSSPFPFGTLYKYIPLPNTELYNDAVDHGFKPPNSLEGWDMFDFEDVHATKDIVRPWISEKDLIYIRKSINLVEALNFQMKGITTNQKKVNSTLNQIELLITNG